MFPATRSREDRLYGPKGEEGVRYRYSRRPRATWLLAFGLMIALYSTCHRELTAAQLAIRVFDEQGSLLPCRVLIRSVGGPCFVPEEAVTVPLLSDRWFVCDGQTRVEPPSGKMLLRVERGLEYVRHEQEFQLGATGATKTITLERWIDMRSRGYLCGENHIHVAPAKLGPMLVAEGLLMLDGFERFVHQEAAEQYVPTTVQAIDSARTRLEARLPRP